MSALTPSTRRRLKKLRQLPSVWEGDRRLLTPGSASALTDEPDLQGECILWVDGVEEVVRAMDIVPSEAGPEAIVRTLLRAMETPHGSHLQPARPQRIVVRDREIQFFLRGVLQELDITVDYAPELPLIDEIFQGLQDAASHRPPQLPPEQETSLMAIAYDIWRDAPWDVLDEEKILSVELNYGDIETLYVSVLGMLGMEFGVLMYRSLDSLKQFRERVLTAEDESEQLERAFLQQDCFFITYDQGSLPSNGSVSHGELPVRPTFGNLHPLEGMRPVLYEEEATVVLVALSALHKFFQQHLDDLEMEEFPDVTGRYRIADPRDAKKKVSAKVSTMPALAAELFELSANATFDEETLAQFSPILRDDLIPPDSFYSLGAIPATLLQVLRTSVKVHQQDETALPKKIDEFPVILIQTSRPKALAIIEELQTAGGVEAICFNPGADPIAELHYDLGILKTQNGDLHLFGEFDEDDPVHIQARKKWDQRCKKTKGQCGLIIAKGLTGSTRGNPQIKDMLALFEVRSLSEKELGLGPLELVRHFDGF